MATLFNKGEGRWKVQISAGSENGRRRRVTKTFRVDPLKSENAQRREVEKLSNAYEVDLQRGIITASGRITVEQLANEWLQGYVQRRKLAPGTQRHYRALLAGRILPRMGKLYVQDIKPKTIDAFLRWLENAPAKTARAKGDTLSGTSCKKYYVLLHSLFKFAVRQGYLTVNPADTVTPPKNDTEEIIPYTAEQAGRFMNALEDETIKWRAYFLLALLSSMRRGELIALDWNDIDLQTGTISITKSAYYANGQGVLIKDPKTAAGKRRVMVPQELCALIEDYRKEQALQRLQLGRDWTDTGAVFTQWNGKRLHLDSPSKRLRLIIAKNGLPPLTPHGLRHTGATLLIAQGANYKAVQGRLGHSRASTTLDIYAHYFEDMEAATSAKLNEVLSDARKRAK